MSLLDDLKMQLRSGDITMRLIVLNVVLFVVPSLFAVIASLLGYSLDILYYVSLSSSVSDLLWKPWSIVTYSFFHAGIWHIIFNMIMFNFAAKVFLTYFTQKQLLGLYVSGGIFAGIIYLISYNTIPALVNTPASVVGASASVMAILFGVATYAPMMQLRLLIIGNIKLWHIAVVFLIIDFLQLSSTNTGGHLAHLGGALFGYIFTTQLKKGFDLTLWFTNIVLFFQKITDTRKRTPFKKVHRNFKPAPKPEPSKIVKKTNVQQQIDAILDKISKSGYESLSKDEKEFLFRAGK
ncbi:MAG: rhomboid family intramembrane serine protease [Flavobacterium sp.]